MLVPELSLARPDSGAAMLMQVFGFRPDGGLWRLGSQRVAIGPAVDGAGHGRVDHLALAVPDMTAALAGMQAAGAVFDAAVTPDGPDTISEFWDHGIRYVYLAGPEGARIELCQRIRDPVAEIGHDHIGIPCASLPTMAAFFEAHGATPVASVALARDDGTIEVRFLAFAGGMLELYQPPGAARSSSGLWSRLRIGGLAARIAGPEGLILDPL